MSDESAMKILSLEFSSTRRSVAVFDGEKVSASRWTDEREEGPFSLIEEALTEANCARGDIECLAIGSGPGSYTGIRSAIAIAQGWQLAAGVKLCGVSSVHAIARQAKATGLSGGFAVLIDAQRGEFYCAQYDAGEETLRELSPLRIVKPATVDDLQAAGISLIGPDPRVVGYGGSVVWPDAAAVAELAAACLEFVAGEKLEPIYLREIAFVKAKPLKL